MVDSMTLPNTLSVRFGGTTGPELLQKCQGKIEVRQHDGCHIGGFLLRKVFVIRLCMFPSCSHCFTFQYKYPP